MLLGRAQKAGRTDTPEPLFSDAPSRDEDARADSSSGGHRIQELAGEDRYSQMKAQVMSVVSQYFRPEFINRLDDMIVFHPLLEEQLHEIARIQVAILSARLASRGLTLRVTDAAIDKLSAAGFDPVYGARPLKRTIQTQLENPLAQEILSGQFVPGNTIVADVVAGNWAFRLEEDHTAQVA